MTLQSKTISELIDEAASLIKQRDNLIAQSKELQAKFDEYEAEIVARMKSEGTIAVSSKTHKFVASDKSYYNIEPSQWDDFFDWLYENKAGYLMTKKINRKALAEAIQNKIDIPGVKEFTETKISLRGI